MKTGYLTLKIKRIWEKEPLYFNISYHNNHFVEKCDFIFIFVGIAAAVRFYDWVKG
jgi:hypothetical protein